ncbi:MAG: tetratricopeptide repeat protein [Bacteroidia bacterium]|nr:tetratricopeptide repeat protein [Bacteroidia bacterium]
MIIQYLKKKQLEYWFHTGLATLENGLYERAAKYGKRIIAHYPDFSGGYDILASALEGLGKNDAALSILEEGVKRVPQSYILWEKLGLQHSLRQKYEEAIECFDKAIAIEDKVESLYYNKAVALANMNKLYEALACLEKIIEINDEFFMAYILQASILNRLGALSNQIEPVDKAIERMEILRKVPFERFGVSNKHELEYKIHENLLHSYLLKEDMEKVEELQQKLEELKKQRK